jgi:lysozyme family protein
MSRFNQVQPRVLRHEGGYVNHPRDPGGATNKGVTQRTYNAFRRRIGEPRRSVREITPQEVDQIYREQYWDVVKADQLPDGVDYVVYDQAVNSGPARSAKWLQRAVGVTPDGVIGHITLDAVSKHEPVTLINRMCDDRMAFLRRLRHWGTFGRGWTRRVADVRRHALSDAAAAGVIEARHVPLEPVQEQTAKAPDSEIRPSRAPEATGATIGGIGAVVTTVAVPAITASENSPILQYAIAGVIVAATVAAGVWFVRKYINKRDEGLV